MDVLLNEGEKLVKTWSYGELTRTEQINNYIAVTDNRFVYTRELVGNKKEKKIARYDLALKNIKAVHTSYTNKSRFNPGIPMLVVGAIFVIIAIAIFFTLKNFTKYPIAGLLVLLGAILIIRGVYHLLHKKSDSAFYLSFEMNTPQGSTFSIGGTSEVPTVGGLFALFNKSKRQKEFLETIQIPEEIAMEIICSLGAYCLK